MGKDDFFREIAMTKHPFDTVDKEVTPAPVTNDILEKTDQTLLEDYYESNQSFKEQQIQFQEELSKLRRKYQPFMQNYLPKLQLAKEQIVLKRFEFRYLEKEEVFTRRNDKDKHWEEVMIPDYRGPAGEDGKWEAYYRCDFKIQKSKKEVYESGKRAVLCFQCVDYKAEIYVNGNFVGEHEGIFAPFSFDITKYLEAENELIILCKNDIPILGTGEYLDGDKIYAATGPGWDDAVTGWHHCPAGAGVFGKVILEIQPELCIDDIFIRPDVDNDSVEVRVGITNYTDEVKKNFNMQIALLPKNYKGDKIGELSVEITCAGLGKNEYRYILTLNEYRLWSGEEPWLYGAQVKLIKQNHILSQKEQTFGIKTFISDEQSTPKGKFYLNHKPIVLRGVNEMGHLQQCAMKEDWNQLVDDILIAKLAHVNYYRVTQRPVQEEIYDYFDMLGMMHQCDLPLFGFLRRPQFAEAIRQVGEMEHLIRRHVSSIMVTFINEPMCVRQTKNPEDKFSKRYRIKGHRHLLRDELEAFFKAARKAVYIENPDRVIKNVEGDYDAPTAEGMPDFHCYTMWYTNHGEPIGRLMRGYLPPVKSGWMIGCGEYGAEGLDNENIIREDYPKEWLNPDAEGNWYPDKIVGAQSYLAHGDWYKEQTTITDWVRESQIHQARATKIMTDAFRRRGDVMNQTALHLLIDAWPSGWMKSLVDCRRQPKRAYFAYQEALVPLRVHLYTGRSCVYSDETIPVEVWLLNDTEASRKLEIQTEIFISGEKKAYSAWKTQAEIPAADAKAVGIAPVSFEECHEGKRAVMIAGILDQKGNILHTEMISFEILKRESWNIPVHAIGEEACEISNVFQRKNADEKERTWITSSIEKEEILKIAEHIKSGGRVVWLLPQEPMTLEIEDKTIEIKSCGDLFYAAMDEKYEKYNVNMLYNSKKGYIDATSKVKIETPWTGCDVAYTYAKHVFGKNIGAKRHIPLVKECKIGKGTLVLFGIAREGRISVNPELDKLLMTLLEEA